MCLSKFPHSHSSPLFNASQYEWLPIAHLWQQVPFLEHLLCAKLCAECFAYVVLNNPPINDVKWFIDQNSVKTCDRKMQPVLRKKNFKAVLAHGSDKSGLTFSRLYLIQRLIEVIVSFLFLSLLLFPKAFVFLLKYNWFKCCVGFRCTAKLYMKSSLPTQGPLI